MAARFTMLTSLALVRTTLPPVVSIMISSSGSVRTAETMRPLRSFVEMVITPRMPRPLR